jgi:hypothetical protein
MAVYNKLTIIRDEWMCGTGLDSKAIESVQLQSNHICCHRTGLSPQGKRTRQLGERSLSFVKKTSYRRTSIFTAWKAYCNCPEASTEHKSGEVHSSKEGGTHNFQTCSLLFLHGYSVGVNIHLVQTYCSKDYHTEHRLILCPSVALQILWNLAAFSASWSTHSR